jgi:hypothetical protein
VFGGQSFGRPSTGLSPGTTLTVDPVRRLSCELPQGRKAARVNGLWRVRGVPYLSGPVFRACVYPQNRR